MNHEVKPENIPPAVSRYALGVVTEENSRLLFVSGQFGAAADGSVPESAEAQNELAWKNVLEIVRAAGMDIEDIVDVFSMVTDKAGLAVYRTVRDRMLNGHRAASTVAICELADPKYKVEISLRAAKRN